MTQAALLEHFLKDTSPKESKKLENVYKFAQKHLSTLARRSGESYFEHGTQVAKTLFEINPDRSLTAVLILHDVQVHPKGAELLRAAPLTIEEKKMVKQMHALRRLHINKSTQDLDYVIGKFSADGRLLLMRMAHRLNDIRHIQNFEKDLQDQIATESLHMYTSIAGRLGIHVWRHEMEDACFRLLYPEAANHLEEEFKNSKNLDEICLNHARKYLMKKLRQKNIPAEIQIRIKSIYSTYRKMVEKQRQFHELTDRLALRIITKNREDCYRVLSLVHELMHPIPGKLKDYIGAPKENGYQSIHTVVYPLPGVTEQPIEVQIRSTEMHDFCEYGIAAHHKYKEKNYPLAPREARVNLFKNLEILKAHAETPKAFEEALRAYFKNDNVMVFDADNHLFHLKKPATALDFACLIYGTRCRRLKEVRINGRVTHLETLLNDGDVLNLSFGRAILYDRAWKNLCQHPSSKKILST